MTPATDVFAFGATLAYAAAADSPFGQGSSEVMLYRVVHEEPDLRGVPDALAPLVYACLAKEPEDRPSTGRLAERLAEIAAREARGLEPARRDPGTQPKAAGPHPERPTGPRAAQYAEQHTEHRAEPRTGQRPAATEAFSVRTPAPGATPRPPGPRTAGGRTPARPATRQPAPRTPVPPRAPAARRSAGPDRRLLRQRLIVFVTVTLLVALGIAAAQGCQSRSSRGLGPSGAPGARSAQTAPRSPLGV